MLHQFRGDAAATAKWAQAGIDLATHEGFSFWLAGGLVLRGWATVACQDSGEADLAGADPAGADLSGANSAGAGAADAGCREAADLGAGVADIRRGLEAWLATGSRTYHTYYLGLLADALQRRGRPAESVRALDEALLAAQLLPEGLYEAELYRLRGRGVIMATRDPAHSDAEECFGKALSTARAQGARSFEARAAGDLASLLRRKGQSHEADELLARTSARVKPTAAAGAQPVLPHAAP
jgi:hypothetical protein